MQPQRYPGQQPQGYPGQQPPGYTGQQDPAYTGQQNPAYPGQQHMAYPGQQPTFPGQKPMVYLVQQNPAYPGQQPTGYPGQQPMVYPGQQPIGYPVQQQQPGYPAQHGAQHGSPFGNTYIQKKQAVGFASYHFESPANVYISYERAPKCWTLSDGRAPPNRKPFLNPVYDARTRTFTGQIEWCPLSFGGHERWDYTMVFSKDFKEIKSGQVQCFFRFADFKPTDISYFGKDLKYRRY
eukprot:613979_1